MSEEKRNGIVRVIITMPRDLKYRAEKVMRLRGYASMSEYIRDLIRRDIEKG